MYRSGHASPDSSLGNPPIQSIRTKLKKKLNHLPKLRRLSQVLMVASAGPGGEGVFGHPSVRYLIEVGSGVAELRSCELRFYDLQNSFGVAIALWVAQVAEGSGSGFQISVAMPTSANCIGKIWIIMTETYKLIARNASGQTQELFPQLIQRDGG